ncbi:hypothetical protein AAEU33_20445 [Chryseobacterium sp. Chry.R1]
MKNLKSLGKSALKSINGGNGQDCGPRRECPPGYGCDVNGKCVKSVK